MNRAEGARPKKRFGQHFLHDQNVVERILRALNPRTDDHIVEIGPGRGALTAPLLRQISHLRVIELDRDVIPLLRQACNQHPGLEIIQADALKFDFGALTKADRKIRLLGNLPYNISTPLLFHLLNHADGIDDMLFMLQKEVVDRMAAGAGDAAYGRLSVSLAARAKVTPLFKVPPGAFNPPPKVDSAIVRLEPIPPPFPIRHWADFNTVVAAAFGQRRKTLANTLRGKLDADDFHALGIDARKRPERITPAEFAALSNRYGERVTTVQTRA